MNLLQEIFAKGKWMSVIVLRVRVGVCALTCWTTTGVTVLLATQVSSLLACRQVYVFNW